MTAFMNSTEIETDVSWGSFIEPGTWVLNKSDCDAFIDQDIRRREKNTQFAHSLLQAKQIPPLARLIYVTSKLFSAIVLWYIFDKHRGKAKSRAGISRRLRKRFVKLGSSYIKLGQIISSGEGLFPAQLVSEFKLLRDQVPPENFSDIKRVIESEFSRPIESIFSYIHPEPVAAASIAQVHKAILITGEEVAVKVQRPNVFNLVKKDIRALSWIAPRMIGRIPVSALANPPALVEVFTETIIEELDFRLEAGNMLEIAKVLSSANQKSIIVPRPKLDLVTKKVLVMEYVDGFTFDEVDKMHEAGIDTKEILSAGLIAFTEGALIYGVFHGDLHGGNLFILKDGRTALLDFGITGRFTEKQRQAFVRLLVAGISGNSNQQIVALRDLGAFPADTDIDAVIKDLGLDGPVRDPTKMDSEQLSNEMNDLTKKLLAYGARAPKELMLFGKNLMFLDGATATLAPDIDILAEIQHVYTYIMQAHGTKIFNDLGNGQDEINLDMDAVRSSFGVADQVDTLTYNDLLKRREVIKKRMSEKTE